jgi:hypothetical protein
MHGGRNDDDPPHLTITLNFRRRPFRWKSALAEFRGEFGRGMEAGGKSPSSRSKMELESELIDFLVALIVALVLSILVSRKS